MFEIAHVHIADFIVLYTVTLHIIIYISRKIYQNTNCDFNRIKS